MKKILDNYIIKKFASSFLIVILCFITIFILIDIIDHLDKFIERNLSSKEIIQYYIFTIPSIISIAFPMSLLISTIFTFGNLQKNNEITAIKASGISIFRIGLPIFVIGILSCFILFYFDNTIVAEFLQKRYEIDKKLKPYRKKFSKNSKTDIYYKLDNQYLEMKKFNYKNDTAYLISIQGYNNYDIKYRLDAKKMIWDTKQSKWNLINCSIRKWNNDNFTFRQISDTLLNIYRIGETANDTAFVTPEFIKKEIVKPDEMNYWELAAFTKKLKTLGDKGLHKWEVNKYYKTAFACIPFIMVLFGIALSIQKPRGGYALGMGLSLIVIFSYMVLIRFGQSLGYNQIINPFLSVWFVNFIFLILGIVLLIRVRT